MDMLRNETEKFILGKAGMRAALIRAWMEKDGF
jgi:hypothetical protein